MGDVNIETEEGQLIVEQFREQIDRVEFAADYEKVYVPSKVAAKWITQATDMKKGVAVLCRMLSQKIKEGDVTEITISENNAKRGFIWWPIAATADGDVRDDLEQAIKDHAT